MDDLDQLYAQMLQVGFVVLHEAVASADQSWVRAELEMLHNIPTLLGEGNPERHLYYWNEERSYYQDWVTTHGSDVAKSRMRTYYAPIWSELGPLVQQRFQLAVQG